MDPTPDQKGTISETVIVHAAAKAGIGVLRPVSGGLRYDLVFDLGSRLLRIQCKTATRRGDVLSIPFYSTRRRIDGFSKHVYKMDEVDAIAAYSPDLERCYLIPPDRFAGRSCIQLRVAATRNNQQRGIHWATDYDFEALDWTRIAGP